jgi:hypothetical protein
MRNCLTTVRRYLRDIARGRGVAYEVSWTERPGAARRKGTVYLTRTEQGCWRPQELVLAGNAAAPDRLVQKVWNWAAERSPRPPRRGPRPTASEASLELPSAQLCIPF